MASVSERAPSTALKDIEALTEIELTVLDNMRLALYPQEIARAGEHNSALFRIVQQPAALAALPCRAEILTADGKTFYVLVSNNTFALTNDITVHGAGTLQLVWGDDAVSHRTQVAQYWVAPSLFAVNVSDPEYQDGLAQMQQSAFVNAEVDVSVLKFFNRAGTEVDSVILPGGATDLDRTYLRLDGGTMSGAIMAPGQTQPAQQQLISREYADSRFISIDGGILVGPINTAYDSTMPSLTNLITRQYAEANFLRLSGGGMSGPLFMNAAQPFISAMGTGNNPMLCIGSNDTGYWRSAGSVIFEVGRTPVAIYTGVGTTYYVPLLLNTTPTQPNQATTKEYVDGQRATSLKFDIPADFPLTSSWQNLYVAQYPIPRGGLSRVRVSVSASVRAAIAGGLSVIGISCQPDIAIDRIERQMFVYNLNGVSSGFTAEFYVEVNGATPTLTLQATALATNPGNNDITIVGGDTFNVQRSQILIQDLGPR